jgi:hypothetical protein
MAITIITAPLTYVPAYNPIIVTASSTNTAQPNFRYIVQVIFSYPSVVTKTLKMSARPDGYLLFDAHRIVENYLSYDFTISDATDSISCPNSYASFIVDIGEEYGTTPAEYLSLADTGNINAINAAVKHSVASFGNETSFISLNIPTQYQILTGTLSTTRKFLTTAPRTGIRICDDSNFYLYITTGATTEPIKLLLDVYDEAGGLLGTEIKTLTATTSLMLRYGVGTKNINDWNAAYLVGASYYTITLADNTPAALGESIRFNIDCGCSKFNETFRLHWLNPLGGFDAFSFNQRFDRNFQIKKANYTKILGSMSAGAFSYTTAQAGKVNFDTRTTETIKINSDWITEEENEWLFTLAKSTQVFWEIDADTYAPVTLTNASYKQQTYAGKKLFNAEFTIEISNEIPSQRQ